MSLPSNSGEQNVVEQDLNACSKDGNEDKSTTLTDDITQTLDWTDEEYKNKLKMRATINSPLTKKWIVGFYLGLSKWGLRVIPILLNCTLLVDFRFRQFIC